MKRYFTYTIFLTPLIMIVPFLFPKIRDLSIYYKPIIFIMILLNTLISIYSIISSKEIEEKIFFILFGISMLIYLINATFDIIEMITSIYPSSLFGELNDFVGKIPILFLLLYRSFKDFRMLKRGSRLSFIIGTVFASTGFITTGIVSTRLAVSNGVPFEDIVFYMPFLVVDILIMALLLALYIAYIELNFRYYIFALFIGYVFAYFGDVYQVFYGVFEDILYRGTSRIFNILTFAYIMITLLWIKGRRISIATITQIEEERKKYHELYLELGDKVQNLLILTQLLRHDLGNDIAVVTNSLELYEENNNVELLDLAIKRLEKMEDRIINLKSTSEISRSLKLEEFPISSIEEVVELFENVDLRIKNRTVSFKANRLLNFILFNIIENSFKHGGEGVKVQITTETVDDSVIIQVKDDGKGMTEEEKQNVYKSAPIIEEKEGLPKAVGLRLARTMLYNIGGSFVIEDNKPKGTIVILSLPLA